MTVDIVRLLHDGGRLGYDKLTLWVGTELRIKRFVFVGVVSVHEREACATPRRFM